MDRCATALMLCLALLLGACTPAPNVPAGPTGPVFTPPELKYRLLSEFQDLFYCDPDFYPVASGDERSLARQRFPELQADTEEFTAILAQNGLEGVSTFNEDQMLLIYREHKKLAAVLLEPAGDSYEFQILLAKSEGTGELVKGTIDLSGSISVLERTPSIATCPICLAEGTLISTPQGEIPVQRLSTGMQVWTLDAYGERVSQPLLRLVKVPIPTGHQVVHLVLEDGRQVWVSPGHPTVEGTAAGMLQAGDSLAGGSLLLAELVKYSGQATYDLLPAGETGFYWANGILLASTLKLPDETNH